MDRNIYTQEIRGRKFLLLPYVESDGKWSISDKDMLQIWKEVVENKLHETVFMSGFLKDDAGWMRLAQNKDNVVHIIADITEKPVIALIAWINSITPCSAKVHYIQFPRVWGKYTKELGEMCLNYWFNMKCDDWELKTLLGETPSTLRTATLYLRKVGFKVIGEIPNVYYDVYNKKMIGMVYSYLSKEDFYGRRAITNE